MPFFFIAPLWFLCLIGGAILFWFPRLRSLSFYILLGSTGFTLFSFLGSTAVLMAAGRWPQLFAHSALLALGGYMVALLGAGMLGGIGGVALAYKLNHRRGSPEPPRTTAVIP